MGAILINPSLESTELRSALYAGQICILPPNQHSISLCELASAMLRDAFDPLDPEQAQFDLPVERYAQILSQVKPAFIHHPECKRLIPLIVETAGLENDSTYFDVPRLRSSTSQDYLTTGIAYAFHPHRDTWYSAHMAQLNWWMPVFDLEPGTGMAFHPRYFSEAVSNNSEIYNYDEWVKTSRTTAVKHIGKDTREQPKPQQSIDVSDQIELITEVGGIILFSAAHLHSSIPNSGSKTRFSIDFRTVDKRDVGEGLGAQNVDSRCTGTALRDFLSCEELTRLDEEVCALYDEGHLPAQHIKQS